MRNKIINKRTDSNESGFTIIELVIVIAVIGILSSIAFVSYNGWKQSTTVAQLKSDLNGVAAAMENYRTFNNTYPVPTSLPSTFVPSSGVTITPVGIGTATTYCVNATPTSGSPPIYHVDQGGIPAVNGC